MTTKPPSAPVQVNQLMWRTYSSGGVNVHTTEVCSDHEWIYSDAADVLGVILRREPVKMPCGACSADRQSDDPAHSPVVEPRADLEAGKP